MNTYVLQNAGLVVLGVYGSAERAMSDNPSADWVRDGVGAWHSPGLNLTIARFQLKS